MDSRYLKSLVTVVERGSIVDAARVEGLTAAAVSQRIKALERQLDVTLLLRIGNLSTPTEACLALLPRAKRILMEVNALAGDADASGLTGPYRIGAISTVLTGTLPGVLRSLTQEASRIKPIIHPGTSRAVFQQLLADELDAAILVAPSFPLPKTVHSQSLFREELILLSEDEPLQGVEECLLTHPYIRYDPLSWGGMRGEQYLKDRGLPLDSLLELDGLEAIAMLVAQGVGVSLVPRWSGLEHFTHCCAMTPVGDGAYDREIVLLTRVPSRRSSMDAALSSVLTSCVSKSTQKPEIR
jgi:DNA-binding transcriptional LysR family regulator